MCPIECKLWETVKLASKNRQDKNKLGFKNQISNDEPDQISYKNSQIKNNLTLRTKIIGTKNVLKVKFDSTWFLLALNPWVSVGPSNLRRILGNP